jgi:hypothetical protein
MRISFGGAASVLTAIIGVLSRIVPHERIIYRVEDPKTGKTIGVFSHINKAEKLGEPIEDLLNPKLVYRSIVRMNPCGEIVKRGTVAFRKPPIDGYEITGLGSDGNPLEIVACSEISLVQAEEYAKEGLEQLMKELGSRLNTGYVHAYGRLHDAREGFALIWSQTDRMKIFRHGNCSISSKSFDEARDSFRSRYT